MLPNFKERLNTAREIERINLDPLTIKLNPVQDTLARLNPAKFIIGLNPAHMTKSCSNNNSTKS